MSNSNGKLRPITRERANDAVHAALRDAILSSVLRPGERLPIADLAKQLEVSLTPVRNAVQLLAAEGLIEVRPRSGTFVASVRAADVRETFQLRRALECLAAELACEAISPREVVALRSLHQAMCKPILDERDRSRHERDNAAFHLAIVKASRNSKLVEANQRLNAHIQIARIHAADSAWQDRLQDEIREHEEILEAIAAKDVSRAVQAVRAHLDRACLSLVRAIEAKASA